MVLAPKARLVNAVYPVESFIVKVTRPQGDPPAFWIEDEGGKLQMAHPFASEQGTVFLALLSPSGVTYHKACITESGEFGIEGAPLEGYSW